MPIATFDDRAPDVEQVTAYDERHHQTYWRLLDAAEENADWYEAVGIIFGIDPSAEPERARLIYDSHLARARWMAETGYRHYLKPSDS
ncbi:DUF2285 domain-containing protein [Sphingobium lactosutens]|uniref:DUF2285 domain-containing protein n=1 Tax=Sphingobium lactosutens TaxID=522773 RepID=UPI0015BF7253|nr:DUF2285 domain-containing protein [Sphingobium lactosutens]NWK97358.1 DUF2285 domain-containing protein [Sphingobium lactosutens]